jgi:hypothetical protein
MVCGLHIFLSYISFTFELIINIHFPTELGRGQKCSRKHSRFSMSIDDFRQCPEGFESLFIFSQVFLTYKVIFTENTLFVNLQAQNFYKMKSTHKHR